MIYSSQRAQAIQKKDIAYLAAGIHDNVVLESIRVDKSLNGNNFIEFKFVAKDGKFMTHTEWEPSKSDNMSDEDLQRKCDNQFARIDQILECYYPNPEDRVFNGESFKEFITWVADICLLRFLSSGSGRFLPYSCWYWQTDIFSTVPRGFRHSVDVPTVSPMAMTMK